MLQKAQTASEKNTEASALEKIQVEVAGSYGLDGKVDITQLNDNLKRISGLKYDNNELDDTNKIIKLPVTVELNEYLYTIFEGGEVCKVFQWIDNSDGTYTNVATKIKIQIGDTVNYNELSVGTQTYTTDTAKGIGGGLGNSGNTNQDGKYVLTSKTYTTEDLSWRVLGINKNGQIELISVNPMSSENRVYLANEEGYLNAETQGNKKGTLDQMCDILYGQGYGAESARSLNVEDVDKLAEIKTDSDKKSLNSMYGIKRIYRFPTTTEMANPLHFQYNTDTGNGYSNTWTDIQNGRCVRFKVPGDTNIINSSNPGYSPELMHTSYIYALSEKIIQSTSDGISIANLLSKGNTKNNINQWVASTYIVCGDWVASWIIRYIDGGNMTGHYMVNSVNESSYLDNCIRPIVTLNSNANLESNGINTWNIK